MPQQNARAILESKIHRAYTVTCDDLFMRGYIPTREARIEIGNVLGELLTAFGEKVGPMLEGVVVSEADVETIAAKMLTQERNESSLVAFGGAIKALGDGRVGGQGLRYGNEQEPDLSPARDWFWAQTYLGANQGNGVDTTINHMMPLRSAYTTEAERLMIEHAAGLILPPVKTTRNDAGLFVETVLDLANEYQAMVYKLCADGKLCWSSGAVQHMVKRTAMSNGTNRVDVWPIGEFAFTPTPAEPRLGAILSLKSLYDLQQLGAEAGSTRAPIRCERPTKAVRVTRPFAAPIKVTR